MRLGVLGPLQVLDDDGREIAVPAARQRVLLAALVVRANRIVLVDELVELVWDGAPPAGAVRTLRTYVVRLRHIVGPRVAARIVTRDPGYLCQLAEDESDVLRFEALCHQIADARRNDAWPHVSVLATRALGEWRDAMLQDVYSQRLRDELTAPMEQLRVQVLEDRIEAQLQLGRQITAVSQLRELITVYPLRERFHAQLMLALADSGRQAEALEAYHDARRVLVEELGIEPGPELRAVQQRILSGRSEPALDSPDDADLSAAGSPSQASSAVAVPRQLPAAPRHFVGRHAELDRLTTLAKDADAPAGTVVISAIDGMAGIGKSALAVQAAHRLAGQFPDGQLFLDLHGYTQGHPPRTASDALTWLLQALGVPPERIPTDGEQAAALYRQRLADTRSLIVLDNASSEAQVRPLLPGGGSCLVLITSRRRLKGLDDAHVLSLDLLAPPDAVALLRAVAGPGRIPADDLLPGEVARLCGYLPLALRIAGALLRHRPAWGLEHLAGLLRDQHRRVAALSDGERRLAGVFDLSYECLEAQHRRLWRHLGLIPGPDVDAHAAAALVEVDPTTAAGMLEDLVDHNLLIENAPGRYGLHDLLRAHARTLAEAAPAPAPAPAPERQTAVDRLLYYYAHTAHSASLVIARYPRPESDVPAPAYAPVLSETEAARSWLRTEHSELDAAFTYAYTHSLDEHVIALAAGLAEILQTDGPWIRALEMHQAAADAAERLGHPGARANALVDLGRVRRVTGDNPGAGEAHSRALEIFREIGNRNGEAHTLAELGRVRHMTGDYPGAGEAHSRALEIFREIGNRDGEAYALIELGRVRHMTGDNPRAGDALTRALEIYRALGNRNGEAYALTHLGQVQQALGDLTGAGDTLACALEIYRAVGNRGNEAWALNYYAATLAATGRRPRALAIYQQALAMNRELNKPDDEAIALEGIAEHHLSAGDSSQGTAYLHEALEIYRRLGMHADSDRVQTRLTAVAP